MRKLFEQRPFWIVLATALVGLCALAVTRREWDFAMIYGVLVAFAVARATGWQMPRL